MLQVCSWILSDELSGVVKYEKISDPRFQATQTLVVKTSEASKEEGQKRVDTILAVDGKDR